MSCKYGKGNLLQRPNQTGLYWSGEQTEVNRVVLPFQAAVVQDEKASHR